MPGGAPLAWAMDLDALPLAALPPPQAEDRAAAARLADPEEARRLVARRGAARLLAARAAGRDAASVLVRRAGGAPALDPALGLRLSLASRGALGVVALARGPVGADLEAVAPAGAPDPVPWRALHPAEAAALRALPAGARAAAFAGLWALKEAAAKAAGLGFDRVEPDAFAVPGFDGARPALRDPSGRLGAPRLAWREVRVPGGGGDALARVALAWW